MSGLLITGVNSSIGRSLAKDLSSNYSVIGTLRSIDNPESFACKEVVTFERGSIFELSQPVETIIHAAGAHPRAKNTPKTQDYIDSNVLMLRELLEFSLNNKVKRVIYLSTDNLDEQSEPSDHYGASKKMGEYLMKDYAGKIESLVSLRLPGVIGHENPPRSFLSLSLEKIKKSEPIEIFNANIPFSFTDNFEIARAVRAIIEQPQKGYTKFSLEARKLLTLREILEVIKKKEESSSEITIYPNSTDEVPAMREKNSQWSDFVPSLSSEILGRFLNY